MFLPSQNYILSNIFCEERHLLTNIMSYEMSLIAENMQRYAENIGKYIYNKGCHSMTPCNPQSTPTKIALFLKTILERRFFFLLSSYLKKWTYRVWGFSLFFPNWIHLIPDVTGWIWERSRFLPKLTIRISVFIAVQFGKKNGKILHPVYNKFWKKIRIFAFNRP
jgi:hypothetical protein